MKEAFSALVGNRELKSFFGDEILSDRLAHAYILEGAEGIGKRTFARQIAAALLCQNKKTGETLPCGVCASCQKVLLGHSADVQTVRKEDGKTQMTVDVVRALREDTLYSPNDGDKKVYIVEDADTMNPQAQNAFLLTLESPPPYVLFLLLCRDANALLETVRSRAPVRRLSPVSDGELRTYLETNEPAFLRILTDDEKNALIQNAGGNVGKALRLLKKTENKTDATETVITALHLLTDRANGADAVTWVNGLVKSKDGVGDFFDGFSTALRDILMAKMTKNATPVFLTKKEDVTFFSQKMTVNRLTALLDLSEKMKTRVLENANVKLLVSQFALESRML